VTLYVNSDNKCKHRCQPIPLSVPHLTPARTVRHTWYQGHYFAPHVSHTPVFVFSIPLLPCCLVRIYILLILQAYVSRSYLNILTFNNFIFCTLPTDNWRILNLEVSTSGTVQCRIVYSSARPDLRIRIRHCHKQLFSPTSGRQFLEHIINTASQNTLLTYICPGKLRLRTPKKSYLPLCANSHDILQNVQYSSRNSVHRLVLKLAHRTT
jgi:hypothetical protein